MRSFISLVALLLAFSAFSVLGGCGNSGSDGMQAPDYSTPQGGTGERRKMPGPRDIGEPAPQ
jgi:hypothetical protein